MGSRLEWPKRRLPSDLVCVQPAQVPFEGVLVARGLSRVLTKIPDQSQLLPSTPMTSRDEQLSTWVGSGAVRHVGQLQPRGN